MEGLVIGMGSMLNQNFWSKKKVLVTGHTGFKGSWLTVVLLLLGAKVTGYALEAENGSLFELLELDKDINSIHGDIRDLEVLKSALKASNAEIVFHMAAQPIVRESYQNPVYTYDVNVMGTVNILEAIRACDSVKSMVNITTDKVYENTEVKAGYRENDRLDGYDPYANSKSCSEFVTASYKRSFFDDNERKIAISTARAGNVIGGGDFAKDRILPDCVRTALKKTGNDKIVLRNPAAIRPYQHVLEPIYAYLLLAEKQYEDSSYVGAYNVGPQEEDCLATGELADLFCKYWGEGLSWETSCCEGSEKTVQPHEANMLVLDASKIREILGYEQRWNIEKAVEKTVEWTKCYHENIENSSQQLKVCTDNQIREFFLK